VAESEPDDNSLQEEVEAFVNSVVERSLPATEQRVNTYRHAQVLPSGLAKETTIET